MKKKPNPWILAWMVFSASWNATAAYGKIWTFDPSHTSVTFTIQHILAKVAGTFDDVQGYVVFDPAQPEKGSVHVTIPVRSINTRVDKRDAHLRSPDFFDAEKYPVMTFMSSQIVPGNDSKTFVARGTLTIKNISRPLDLPFVYLGTRPHPFDASKEIIGFEAQTIIDRLEFGVGNGQFFRQGLIGKDVFVAIFVEMLREREESK
ncbi:MAG: YceI family protein [Desulfosoma sp.]